MIRIETMSSGNGPPAALALHAKAGGHYSRE